MKTIEVAGGNRGDIHPQNIGNYHQNHQDSVHPFGYNHQSTTDLYRTPRKEEERGWRERVHPWSEDTKQTQNKYKQSHHERGIMTETHKKEVYQDRRNPRNSPFVFNDITHKKENQRRGERSPNPENEQFGRKSRPWFEGVRMDRRTEAERPHRNMQRDVSGYWDEKNRGKSQRDIRREEYHDRRNSPRGEHRRDRSAFDPRRGNRKRRLANYY